MVAVVFGTAGLSGTVVAAGREPNCWRSADRGDWGERYCSIEERTIRPGGVIRVDAREIDGHLLVEISDEGAGLPEGFDINQPRKSLGFRVINGLVKQLMGELKISKNIPRGALFTIKFPLDPP